MSNYIITFTTYVWKCLMFQFISIVDVNKDGKISKDEVPLLDDEVNTGQIPHKVHSFEI